MALVETGVVGTKCSVGVCHTFKSGFFSVSHSFPHARVN